VPPRKPKPWADVFPDLWWGNSAPQNMDNRHANKYASSRDRRNYDDVGEDCLRINVWTPAINDGLKRPVMFYSTVQEQFASWADSTLENVTMDQVVERLKPRAGFGPGLGERAREVVDAYAKAFPGRKPVERRPATRTPRD